MERKNEGAKRLSICRRLVNFIVESFRFQTFRQVTPGRRTPSAKREESNSLMATSKGLQYDMSVFEEEGEAALVPPIRTIPVEHRNTKKSSIAMANLEEKPEDPRRSSNQSNQDDSRKKKTVRLRNSSKDDKDITLKIKPFMGESQESSKSPEKSEGAAMMPLEPAVGSVSNIDTKFDTFIRERKKSFELS